MIVTIASIVHTCQHASTRRIESISDEAYQATAKQLASEKCPRCQQLEAPLTPSQQHLYDRLVEDGGVWCGSAQKLAAFANLPYPFDPEIVAGLIDRKLIRNNCLDFYYIHVCALEEVE